MIQERTLSETENLVLSTLLRARTETQQLMKEVDGLVVVEMKDGGMGSLRLHPRQCTAQHRLFGRQIATGEFEDADSVPVLLAINLDRDGHLFELDVWKVDYSPVIAWPTIPSAIRIDYED
jgi:hypothetical protein